MARELGFILNSLKIILLFKERKSMISIFGNTVGNIFRFVF
ncbi:hypothetical protein GMES_0198 [Paraglaciecola mesophila KMM 241]|uniref:Uncharacterized protein n=1 Tax=Paraglaciecola mesophila KMM 241 TaxID=1128912 RepID=K6Z0I5_9ALTE|nr:hypothetical protein GMES_0198 [Paraglaciecola mesophila KMM 241]